MGPSLALISTVVNYMFFTDIARELTPQMRGFILSSADACQKGRSYKFPLHPITPIVFALITMPALLAPSFAALPEIDESALYRCATGNWSSNTSAICPDNPNAALYVFAGSSLLQLVQFNWLPNVWVLMKFNTLLLKLSKKGNNKWHQRKAEEMLVVKVSELTGADLREFIENNTEAGQEGIYRELHPGQFHIMPKASAVALQQPLMEAGGNYDPQPFLLLSEASRCRRLGFNCLEGSLLLSAAVLQTVMDSGRPQKVEDLVKPEHMTFLLLIWLGSNLQPIFASAQSACDRRVVTPSLNEEEGQWSHPACYTEGLMRASLSAVSGATTPLIAILMSQVAAVFIEPDTAGLSASSLLMLDMCIAVFTVGCAYMTANVLHKTMHQCRPYCSNPAEEDELSGDGPGMGIN